MSTIAPSDSRPPARPSALVLTLLWMLAYHHGIWADLDAIIADAAARDVGIVAMKTLKGARHQNLTDFRDDAASYA